MCLYPRLIRNRRYLPNKKNGGVPPICNDHRKLMVPVGCGVCKECLQQKSNQWRIRLYEELKLYTNCLFVTLTFSPESLKDISTKYEIKSLNAIAGQAVRLFLERWRKRYKKSIRHWLITELGENESERIHLHGILYSNTEITKTELETIWQYGVVDVGEYCTLQTINYITKYITKTDFKHKGYVPVILCSSGIGKTYTERPIISQIHQFNDKKTIEYYRYPNGTKCNLPIYYRNKLFTEEQREELWINRLNQNKRYVLGVEINDTNTIDGEDRYFRVLKKAQEKNIQAGYGDNTKEWQKKEYNLTLRMLKKKNKDRD